MCGSPLCCALLCPSPLICRLSPFQMYALVGCQTVPFSLLFFSCCFLLAVFVLFSKSACRVCPRFPFSLVSFLPFFFSHRGKSSRVWDPLSLSFLCPPTILPAFLWPTAVPYHAKPAGLLVHCKGLSGPYDDASAACGCPLFRQVFFPQHEGAAAIVVYTFAPISKNPTKVLDKKTTSMLYVQPAFVGSNSWRFADWHSEFFGSS